MAKVTYVLRDGEHELEVRPGMNLLRAAVDSGLPYRYGCEQATCGKCICQIEAGGDQLSKVTVNEPLRLSQTLVDMGFRLACQAKVRGDGLIRLRQP
jgi:ferredoxin